MSEDKTTSSDKRRMIIRAFLFCLFAALFFATRPLLADPNWKVGMPIDEVTENMITFFQLVFAILAVVNLVSIGRKRND